MFDTRFNEVRYAEMKKYFPDLLKYFEKKVEIDFYVPEEKLAIQVSLQVLDQIDTREREIGAFVKLKNFIGDATCLLITNSEEEELDYDGVHVSVVPVWKWLLQKRKQDI